jgi:soluble lytic murein transglycosylase-like protein
MTVALVPLACRTPAPTHLVPQAQAAVPAVALAPPLELEAPSAPPEAAPEDPSLVLVRSVLTLRAARMQEPDRERLAQALVDAEREVGISVFLLVALIEQESRFDPMAKGPRGSLGLMQVRPFVGRDVAARIGVRWEGDRTLFDPVANVRIGSNYLREVLDRFGSEVLALAAYNMGPNRLARRLARGDDRSPTFVRRVLRDYQGLQREFASSETGIGG